jgi:hypothetical protein
LSLLASASALLVSPVVTFGILTTDINRRVTLFCVQNNTGVTPLQGCVFLFARHVTQGVALGWNVLPFQGCVFLSRATFPRLAPAGALLRWWH